MGSPPYTPIGYVWPRVANSDGILVSTSSPHTSPASPTERINERLIPLAQAQTITQGRLNILPIGRSGFTDEDDSRHFATLMEQFFDGSFHLLRRAGVDLRTRLLLSTSATGGTVDFGVRRAAALHAIPTLAFICRALMCYVDPQDPYIPHVVDTDALGRDYSEVSIGMSDVVLSLPGGGFALFSDLPNAIIQKKEVVVVYDPSVNPHNVSVVDGSLLIGNHGVTLVREQRRVTKAIQRLLRETEGISVSAKDLWNPSNARASRFAELILGRSPIFGKLTQALAERGQTLSPQEIFRRVRVMERSEEWAELLYRRLGHTERLEKAVEVKTSAPVKNASQSFNGAQLILSITGRSQWINKTSGVPESHHMEMILGQLGEMLCGRLGCSRRDIGIVHGMSNYGSDGATLRRLVLMGHPALGIVKPEWMQWTDAAAKRRSDYIATKDTYEAFSEGYLGKGLGFQSDVLIVFEGNAGVKNHIKKAVELGIPVIVVPLTNDPMFGDFYDVQKAKVFRDRLLNIGKWVSQSEREKAKEYLVKRIEALLEMDVDQRNLVQEIFRLRALLAAWEEEGKNSDTVKIARTLLNEIDDLMETQTTIEGNPSIQTARSAEEILAIIEKIWLIKKEKIRNNLLTMNDKKS